MKYRRLGNAGVKVSEISLGGWLTFDSDDSRASGREVIDAAFENGINFFDTANIYGQGVCETVWGSILQSYERSSYVLATKVFFPMGDGPNDRGLSRKHIMEQCEASLRRLGTKYIDLYQCHRQDLETPLEETIGAMDDLVRQGKIHYWGFSCWSPERIEKTFELCRKHGYYAPVSSQPKYNMLNRDIENDVVPVCEQNGVGQVVFCPLEQGLLTGKYKPGQALPQDSRAANDEQNMFMKDLVSDQKRLEHIAMLNPVAEEVGCTLAQLALAWVLAQPGISSCITGATRAEQVGENTAASGVELDDEMLKRIDEIILPVSYEDIIR